MAGASAKPLRIGLVLDDSLDTPDGVQQYVLAIGEWLRRQGHEVHYLVGATARQDVPNIHSLSRNVSVRFNQNRMSMPLPAGRRRLRRFLAEQHFDVLHVQVPYSPYLAHRLILAAADTTAVIGTFHILPHSRLVHGATRALAGWTRRSLKRFDAMLSVSPAAAAFARRSFGVDSRVLPNVIDYQRFQAAKPLPEYDDAVPTILFLGRLVPRKGCQTLLEAVHELVKQPNTPEFRVVICGKGPLAAKLQAYVAAHDLQAYVEFVGFVSETDKPRYYASADIAVFPSSGGESFGIVLLEAMASGRAAVLAGDNPGYRSVMEPHPELLFEPRDATKLAQLLTRYLTDNAQRQAAAAWGTDYAAEFDTGRVGRRLLAVYDDALHKRRKG